MPTTSPILRRPLQAAVAAFAVALLPVLTVGAPASAAYTPDGTMTFTALPGTYEGDGAAMAGFCPDDTASVTITSTPSAGVTIPPISYLGAGGGDPADEGRFETIGSYTVDTLVVPAGSDVIFQASCLDAGSVVLATASSTVTTYASAATLVVPSTAAIGSAVTITGTCVDPSDGYVGVEVDHITQGGLFDDGTAQPAGPWSVTGVIPVSAGLVPGDVIDVVARCRVAAGGTVTSTRLGTITLTAAAVPPAADPTLPATGSELTAPLGAIALAFLVAGAALVGRRRSAARR